MPLLQIMVEDIERLGISNMLYINHFAATFLNGALVGKFHLAIQLKELYSSIGLSVDRPDAIVLIQHDDVGESMNIFNQVANDISRNSAWPTD